VNLYREVDFEKEPCVFVGVHCLRWHEHPDQPTIGFVEVELEDITEVRALQARVAELEEQLEARIAELASIGDGE
jgi:hypothetical protein